VLPCVRASPAPTSWLVWEVQRCGRTLALRGKLFYRERLELFDEMLGALLGAEHFSQEAGEARSRCRSRL